ncbi:ubiquitin carboxyl-terminal hydrolase 2 [Metarhizium rileyi]|uniref:Ubiquitin carboxyl-terminal hydrolase n=1 Tax=Metarhizium rileyi (strain RCEF 4871) TaxID=1649241 RepID=A0A167F9M3_METRR|nr:ubiquitin carboxyl-terminal hydrolase 2 [Metarhizium rileyi RCEF 4871]
MMNAAEVCRCDVSPLSRVLLSYQAKACLQLAPWTLGDKYSHRIPACHNPSVASNPPFACKTLARCCEPKSSNTSLSTIPLGIFFGAVRGYSAPQTWKYPVLDQRSNEWRVEYKYASSFLICVPPVESDAGVFTSLIENLGVKDVQCEELISLDPDDLLVLQPLYGVIFLFRYPTDRPYASPDGPLDGSFDHDAAEHMFFAAQTIQNACATQALLSVLMNKTEDVDVGSQLRDFRDFTMVLPPEFRGEALSNSDLIREVHNSFARSSPFADETQKTGDPEDAFHFIAYTTVNDTLYELDGLQPAPISHGPCTLHEFPNMIVEVLQRRVARYETTEIRFNLLAMCRDLRIRARRFGEHELMAREEMKRRNWQFENALRRHNFVGFAGELLKGVVDYKLHEGGDAAVIKWVDESLQRRMAAEKALRGGDEDVDMH